MGVAKKEMLVGVLFAVVVAIFMNYSSIERIVMTREIVNDDLIYQLLFSTVWFVIVSLLFYLFYVTVFNLFSRIGHSAVLLIPMFVVAVVIAYYLSALQPTIRELFVPDNFDASRMGSRPMRPPRGMMSATMFKHLLVLTLNLLFCYIQRLLYTNQAIARRNEQLQFETERSQHNALLQQINPHFFFNSLNSLRYIIMRGESDGAVEYLDNLIAIFRKTLKASSNTLHRLSDELSIVTSYTHIVERRFEGKFTVEIDVNPRCEEMMIAPLTLLTLVENVVKHNKIATKQPVKVRIYADPACEIVVENNIVHKFEEVEPSGIGLKNLNLQYELLTGRGINVEQSEEIFRVTLPLIERS